MDKNNIPVMLYDGGCAFCRRWVKKWAKITGKRIRYEPYQEALNRFPQASEDECRKAVQLIMPDNSVFSGAHAVFKALAVGRGFSLSLWLYEHLPLFARISEWGYRFIARHRPFLSKISGGASFIK